MFTVTNDLDEKNIELLSNNGENMIRDFDFDLLQSC